MKTKKQEELVASFLSMLGEDDRAVYRDLITYLSELGYNPNKDKASIVFKHELHNKQMAKVGIKNDSKQSPFFALRFSACRDYSKRFADIVSDNIKKRPARVARCVDNACGYCAGEPYTHVYTCKSPDGVTKTHCGAYALEIPDISSGDVGEIKKLIKEEHDYLLKHEANISS